jgi:zinc and cadmium transporter
MELIYLLIASLVIMLASLSGVVFVTKKLGHWTSQNIQYLVAFSAGVFLIVSYDIVTEALEFSDNKILVLGAIILGFLVFYLFEKFYPEVHCHHEDNKCATENSRRGARKILIGDGLHNLGDGILLAPVFVLDIRLGLVAAFGILVHEFVQEVSEFFVLKFSGYTTREALVWNFVASSTILAGALIGFYLSSLEYLIGPLLGLAAGAFIYLLVIDLIPESVKNSHRERKYLNYVAWALLGILVILSLNFLSL